MVLVSNLVYFVNKYWGIKIMPTTFDIEGRHVEVTPALEDYIRTKLGKVTNIFINRDITVHVILSVDKLDQKIEAQLKIAGDKNPIFASANSEDMYQSIDRLEDKLYSQVKKYHDKKTDYDKHK